MSDCLVLINKVFFLGDKNVLNQMVAMAVQLCNYNKKPLRVYFKND